MNRVVTWQGDIVRAEHPSIDFDALDSFKKALKFPPSYPRNIKQFYAPVDNVHGVLKYLLNSARESLVIGMYGFDDDQLADIILAKLRDENVRVQLTLDSSQAGGVHERKLLGDENFPASSIAVGRSEKGAIMHLKEIVVDGLVLITGSTNWSASGQSKQDNSLTVINDPAVCALATNRIGHIHASILSKAAA